MADAPSQIGRYQVKKTIGRGGMGTLLLAWDPDLERETAIKILRDDDDELRERFAFEARSAAKLRHPNIVTIFDVGTYDGQPFIAMEYIHGETLAEIVARQAPLSTVKRLRLIEELCEGLGFAHERGVIHRDVKPANLMVASDGVLKVLDFGIARLAGSTGRTQAGMLIGTPNYMSPEQIVGREIDQRSDLFAVGALLYEILTYRQAFPGNLQTGILHRILNLEPEPLLEHAVGVDPALADIVGRALQKQPDNRYANLNDMRRDLLTVRERLEASAGKRGAQRSPDSDKWARRRADEVSAHLARAQTAFASGDYESASQSCEQALMLDADDVRVNELFEHVRRVLDERQAEQWLDVVERHLAQGELTAAQAQLKRVAELTPTLARLAQVQPVVERALEKARQEREEARVRAESVARAVARAESGLRKGDLVAAEAAIDTMLTLQPGDTRALGLRSRVDDAIRTAVAVASREARRRLAAGDERGAEDVLLQFRPASPARDDALAELRAEIAHARARLTACLASADRFADAGDLDAAIATLEAFAPPDAEIVSALALRRAEKLRLVEAGEEPDGRWLEETPGLKDDRQLQKSSHDLRGDGHPEDDLTRVIPTLAPDTRQDTFRTKPEPLDSPVSLREDSAPRDDQTPRGGSSRLPHFLTARPWRVSAVFGVSLLLGATYFVGLAIRTTGDVGMHQARLADAERLHGANQRVDALAILEQVLATAPDNGAARQTGERWLAAARARMDEARHVASLNGSNEANSAEYAQASKEDQAQVGFAADARIIQALASAWRAADLYARAKPAALPSVAAKTETPADRRTLAQALYAKNQPVEALRIIDGILEELPGDAATIAMRRRWSSDAAQQLTAARTRAAAAGSTVANSPDFARAQTEEASHASLLGRRDDGAAILAARRAIDLYARARPTQTGRATTGDPSSAPLPSLPGVQPPVVPAPIPDTSGRAGLAPPQTPAGNPTSPPPQSTAATGAGPTVTPPVASDENAVRVEVWAVLDVFGRGYASRDVGALRTAWPGMTNAEASSYTALLDGYRSIDWTYTGRTLRMAADGNSAQVTAQVTRNVQPNRGDRLREDISYTFTVVRRSGRWEITRVVPGTIRREPLR
jgi:predicted Ser/Thr protein kinase